MKITLYWSEYSNDIYYTYNNNVFRINGEKWWFTVYMMNNNPGIHKIGEI